LRLDTSLGVIQPSATATARLTSAAERADNDAVIEETTTSAGPRIDRRVERVQLETDRHVIVGNVTLPPEGYQSRFSDFMNRGDVAFVPLVDVEVKPLHGGEPMRQDFLAVGKAHVRFAFTIEELS
jgi:hypothetical protein